jgi:tetratricopeptide (TPR) repeat protein
MRGAWAFASVVLLASAAEAQDHSPTVWERAASPSRAVADRAHRQVEALLLGAFFQRNEESGAGQDRLARAMQLLEQVGAERSADVRLRFDFGHVAYGRSDYQRAALALESALRDAPDHPLATRAYSELGICLAKLGRAEDEIAAYDGYLAREPEKHARALTLYNRGDAHMLLAQHDPARLAIAIRDYRAALDIEPDLGSAHWGLAIALDRSGDAPGAIAEAKIAIVYDPLEQQISGALVFFVPPYDQYWYEALSAMARAQQLDDAPSSVLLWETAVAKWAAFVAVAASDDRWIPLAKAHLVSSQRQLDQAKKKTAREAKTRRSHDDSEP